MFVKRSTCQLWLASKAVLLWLVTTAPIQAQITSDGTLSTPTQVETADNLHFTLSGGSQAGGNLFHSFREFSVPNGGSAIFDSAPDVQNIISRVTGGSVSNIDGVIKANGNANLFLINPNGIIFGSNAALQIGGSFLASTANSLIFKDGTEFSATNPQTSPLLTVSVPIGLQFGETPGSIYNQSQVTRFFPETGFEIPVGLEVKPGKTLALIGGQVFLEGGGMFAPEGRIELGSVEGSGFVNLTLIDKGLAVGYEGVNSFQNIQLSQAASIDTTGVGEDSSSGDIYLRGRQISISDGSQVTSVSLGVNQGGVIAVEASESVEAIGGSELKTDTFLSGAAGNISIKTGRLLVGDNSRITALTQGQGLGGNITINASEFVEVNGSGSFAQITTQAVADGNAGKVEITTGQLILRDGGQITSSTIGRGNGGTIFVNASESVQASGQGENDGEVDKSGLLVETSGKFTTPTGNGGSLTIDTGRLVIQDGANVSVSAIEGSTGQAGTLKIDASESVEISGAGSTLQAESQSPKPAGDLIISTKELLIQDGAEVSATSQGSGNAGNIDITANSLLMNRGNIVAETRGNPEQQGANINLKVSDLLRLENESLISATAFDNANGGNINIDTNFLIASPPEGSNGSDITANASRGRGGNIKIEAQGLFNIEERRAVQGNGTNDIDASSEFGLDGVVQINDPNVDPQRALEELPENVVDVSQLVSQNLCKASRGSQFIITGRGGLPDSPNEAFSSDDTWEDWRIATQESGLGANRRAPVRGRGEWRFALTEVNQTPTTNQPRKIVEAQGWVVNAQGKVVLTAEPIAVASRAIGLTQSGCQ
jgi:filamentous hemagglutinin family protein